MPSIPPITGVSLTDRTIAGGTVSGRVNDALTFDILVTSPALWYPAGMGEQPLYTVSVTLKNADGGIEDQIEKRVGFRQIEYDHPDGARTGSLPYALRVNGGPHTDKMRQLGAGLAVLRLGDKGRLPVLPR